MTVAGYKPANPVIPGANAWQIALALTTTYAGNAWHLVLSLPIATTRALVLLDASATWHVVTGHLSRIRILFDGVQVGSVSQTVVATGGVLFGSVSTYINAVVPGAHMVELEAQQDGAGAPTIQVAAGASLRAVEL